MKKTKVLRTIRPASRKRKAFDKKVREYRAFLRGDEDYSWHFIIRLLRYKIQRTQRHIVDHDAIVDARRVGLQMQKVIDLLERIEEAPYFRQVHGPFWKKYGKPRMIYGKPDERGSVPVTVRYAKETARNKSKLRREFLRLARKEDTLRKKDLKKALGLIQKNIWFWWD